MTAQIRIDILLKWLCPFRIESIYSKVRLVRLRFRIPIQQNWVMTNLWTTPSTKQINGGRPQCAYVRHKSPSDFRQGLTFVRCVSFLVFLFLIWAAEVDDCLFNSCVEMVCLVTVSIVALSISMEGLMGNVRLFMLEDWR